MGYIEYLKGDLDTNGNVKWYYRFFSNEHIDVTDHFNFLGRKVRLKYCNAILLHVSPSVLYEMFNNGSNFKFYTIPELDKAQQSIDSCNHRNGCDSSCSLERRQQCSKLIKHSNYADINRLVKEAISSPRCNYIDKGTKKDYDKKAANKLQFDSFNNVNILNKNYNNIPKYKIVEVVNNGNTCRLVDTVGNEHIVDISMILRNIIDLKAHVVNLEVIKNWKNFC